MADRSRVPWLRIAAEGVVIVASILLAFAADRWWDERQDRATERAVLEDLRVEAELNLVELTAKAEPHRSSEMAAVRLIRIVDGDVPLLAEPIDSLLWAAFLQSATFEARTGTLDALLSTGDLDVIRDDRLRTALASWRARLRDMTEEEEWIEHDVRSHWRPYLLRSDLLRPAERIYGFFRDIGPGARAYDFGRILEDPEFENLVLLRIEDERLTLDEYRTLAHETEAVLDRIEAALDALPAPGG